jgi:hypothetical protein
MFDSLISTGLSHVRFISDVRGAPPMDILPMLIAMRTIHA